MVVLYYYRRDGDLNQEPNNFTHNSKLVEEQRSYVGDSLLPVVAVYGQQSRCLTVSMQY